MQNTDDADFVTVISDIKNAMLFAQNGVQIGVYFRNRLWKNPFLTNIFKAFLKLLRVLPGLCGAPLIVCIPGDIVQIGNCLCCEGVAGLTHQERLQKFARD